MLIRDFNARTGVLCDFITIEDAVAINSGIELADNDFFNTKCDLEKLGITTDRHNADTCTNNRGYRLIEMCKNLDVKIVNGRVGSDHGTGAFTCQTASGQSVVDYAIASPHLILYFHFHLSTLTLFFKIYKLLVLFSSLTALLASSRLVYITKPYPLFAPLKSIISRSSYILTAVVDMQTDHICFGAPVPLNFEA